MMEILLRGLVIGFLIAAPVGPIGILCIRRTLAEGRAIGLATGLGAATADAIYGSVAAFGLTIVSDFLLGQRLWFQLIGGAFLLYLGIRTALSRPSSRLGTANASGIGGAYSSTFFLTCTNPMTILSFVAVFAGFRVVLASGDFLPALTLVAGVFSGSAAWWFLLSGGVSLFRTRFDLHALRWVNQISGIIIIAFALFALTGLVRGE
jgi:threonine/homoserine/homoserine lactone efflux protein